MGFFTSKSIDSVGDVVAKTGSALDNLFTSDDERLSRAEVMARIKQKPDEWAHELNVLNAKSSSLFVSGWRPGLGWVCVVSAILFFVPQYLAAAVIWLYQCYFEILVRGSDIVLPAYPVSDEGLWHLVTLMIGSGALRTVEKMKGVHRN